MKRLLGACIVVLLVVFPSAAFAQASITGIVRDSSGAVLPGVTVEASSPVLIEKVRSAVADGAGQYRIVNLRAGTYTVTFTLPGFGSVKREGIELTGAFVATVNGEMRVGTLEETVTVTGETPIVDVQSVRLQTVMNNDMISALPTSRAYNSLMTLMPNAVAAGGAASDAQTVPGMVVFGGAGGRGNEGRLQLDGLSVGSAFNGAGVSAYIPDIGNAAEISMVSSGGLGEAEVGGPTMNIVPKEGGNTIGRFILCRRHERGDGGQQLFPVIEGPRPDHAGRTAATLGPQSRHRRADRQRPPLVLRRRARRRQPSVRARHVRECQRRRSEQVDVRGGHVPASGARRLVFQPVAAPDRAGDAAEQVQCVLGRAGAV